MDYYVPFLNRSLDKKKLSALLLWVRFNCGESEALKLVENLKSLGFSTATHFALSLGIDDLAPPKDKNQKVITGEHEIAFARTQWKQGKRTSIELFQQIVDTWHQISENLKDQVIDQFHGLERMNSVYMMAFSGARGNLSQVRQLVSMRGLMANPQGEIVGFPIISNFREGLTMTEYFVSCYGARKGVIDTALRTADAGYLTRRLVDVAHHVVVRNNNCGTTKYIPLKANNKGLSLAVRLVGRVSAETIYAPAKVMTSALKKVCPRALLTYPEKTLWPSSKGFVVRSNIEDVTPHRTPYGVRCAIGHSEDDISSKYDKQHELSWNQEQAKRKIAPYCRTYIEDVPLGGANNSNSVVMGEGNIKETINKPIIVKNQEITEQVANTIVTFRNKVKVRSPLTCVTPVCQLCYGYALAESRRVSIGEAVGILAAQSLGEPGTQLTLRTFHTGGVFSGDQLNALYAPYEGRVYFSDKLSGNLIRTAQGDIAFLTSKKGTLHIVTDTQRMLELSHRKVFAPRSTVQVHVDGRTYIEDVPPGGAGKAVSEVMLEKDINKQQGHNFSVAINTGTIIFVRNYQYVLKNQLLTNFFSQQAKIRVTSEEYIFADFSGQVVHLLPDMDFWVVAGILPSNSLSSLRNSRFFYNNLFYPKSFYTLKGFNGKKFFTNAPLACRTYIEDVPYRGACHTYTEDVMLHQRYKQSEKRIKTKHNMVQPMVAKKLHYNVHNGCTSIFNSKWNFLYTKFYKSNYSSRFIKFIDLRRTAEIKMPAYGVFDKANDLHELKSTTCYQLNTNKLIVDFQSRKRIFSSSIIKVRFWSSPYALYNFIIVYCSCIFTHSYLGFVCQLKTESKFEKIIFNKQLHSFLNIFSCPRAKQDRVTDVLPQDRVTDVLPKESQPLPLLQIIPKMMTTASHFSWHNLYKQTLLKNHILPGYIEDVTRANSFGVGLPRPKVTPSMLGQPLKHLKFSGLIVPPNLKIQTKYFIYGQSKYKQKILFKKETMPCVPLQHQKTLQCYINSNHLTSIFKLLPSHTLNESSSSPLVLGLPNTFGLGRTDFKNNGISPVTHLVTPGALINAGQDLYMHVTTTATPLAAPPSPKVRHTNTEALGVSKAQTCTTVMQQMQGFFWNYPESKGSIRSLKKEKLYNHIFTASESGQVIKIDSDKITLRRAHCYFISSKGSLSVVNKEYIKKGDGLFNLKYEKLLTGDIVQGLGKIEELLEYPKLSLNLNFKTCLRRYLTKISLDKAIQWSYAELQLYLVQSIQQVYVDQGCFISDKHLEIIVRQATCFGIILFPGDTGFLHHEVVPIENIEKINKQLVNLRPRAKGLSTVHSSVKSSLAEMSTSSICRTAPSRGVRPSVTTILDRWTQVSSFTPHRSLPIAERNEHQNQQVTYINSEYKKKKERQKAIYYPHLKGITWNSLNSNSILSAASFQETRRVLRDNLVTDKVDFLKGIKERIILGELLEIGTGFFKNRS